MRIYQINAGLFLWLIRQESWSDTWLNRKYSKKKKRDFIKNLLNLLLNSVTFTLNSLLLATRISVWQSRNPAEMWIYSAEYVPASGPIISSRLDGFSQTSLHHLSPSSLSSFSSCWWNWDFLPLSSTFKKQSRSWILLLLLKNHLTAPSLMHAGGFSCSKTSAFFFFSYLFMAVKTHTKKK